MSSSHPQASPPSKTSGQVAKFMIVESTATEGFKARNWAVKNMFNWTRSVLVRLGSVCMLFTLLYGVRLRFYAADNIISDSGKKVFLPSLPAPSNVLGNTYQRSSMFPGMDDNTTCMEGCSARIIAQLYRHWDEQSNRENPDNQPFSLILYQRNASVLPETYLESTEPWPHGCPGGFDPNDCSTLPYFMQNCPTSDDTNSKDYMSHFNLYTDGAKAMSMLSWFAEPCSQTMAPNSTVLVADLPLIDDAYHGIVAVDEMSYAGPMIYIPDPISNSCWVVDCGISWQKDDKKWLGHCIADAVLGLVKVPLVEFVDNIKKVWCE